MIRVHGPKKCILKWDAFTETFQDLPIQIQISKLVHIFFSRTLSVGQAYITISCIGMILKSIFFHMIRSSFIKKSVTDKSCVDARLVYLILSRVLFTSYFVVIWCFVEYPVFSCAKFSILFLEY